VGVSSRAGPENDPSRAGIGKSAALSHRVNADSDGVDQTLAGAGPGQDALALQSVHHREDDGPRPDHRGNLYQGLGQVMVLECHEKEIDRRRYLLWASHRHRKLLAIDGQRFLLEPLIALARGEKKWGKAIGYRQHRGVGRPHRPGSDNGDTLNSTLVHPLTPRWYRRRCRRHSETSSTDRSLRRPS